jgi:outer membrane protein insertion porin family
VNVEEQSTGELSFGLGYSTTNGPLGLIKISERNLLGRGSRCPRHQPVLRHLQHHAELHRAHFLGRPISAGVDLHFDPEHQQHLREFNIPYESRIWAWLRAGYDISEFLHHNIRYSLIRQTLSNVSQFASLAIQRQEHQSELAHQQRVHL